jgi:hypothetical protein
MTFKQAKQTLKAYGIRIDKTDGEYRVAYALTNDECSAYYTNALDDAFETALCMANVLIHEQEQN